jgi:hypothetical protein
MRNLSFIILNIKIHGVAQETRPVACVLDLEGLALMTRGLVALFYLLYFLIAHQRLSLMFVGVPNSFVADLFGSDAWTQSFFASGSARSSSGCFVVVRLPSLFCR